MLLDDFEEEILLKPAYKENIGCDSLKIISGYTDAEMIARHLTKLSDLIAKR